jgi:hypothetical protein
MCIYAQNLNTMTDIGVLSPMIGVVARSGVEELHAKIWWI